ncbi:MAG: hypothetical protein UY16_C0007G0025 [Candidatus Gottesmanbacteria bacterium GW2011_GWA2_47_9]|uniref:Transposase IS200-like domain-containing protein n=1 Tax=Candidatus Gottesmanbacteria bacterium GW2011_GWA2_47_9 TaxID=1618445 RepID=A0A0G1U303_9BACT|nr:MAG: hypothetical protein UY16_C0007G0025 [Candidatus Gottesmanbacteria bacterium GW2011_GWA2_47_9]
MPAKNELKLYIVSGYYHLYNRGVDKRLIFLDEQDYAVFLRTIKDALSPLPPPDPTRINSVLRKNLFNKVDLLCFVLMPNHFHLFVYQSIQNGIETFMRSIITRYVKYFNKKYERGGHLFQGRYKAIMVENEPYFLHLSRYIHRNPMPNFKDYPYSSYPYYLGKKHADWLKIEPIHSFFGTLQRGIFSRISSYQHFVEDEDIEDAPEEIRMDEE